MYAQGTSATGQLHMTVTYALRWAVGGCFELRQRQLLEQSPLRQLQIPAIRSQKTMLRCAAVNTGSRRISCGLKSWLFRFLLSIHMCRAPPPPRGSESPTAAPPRTAPAGGPFLAPPESPQADFCNSKNTFPATFR